MDTHHSEPQPALAIMVLFCILNFEFSIFPPFVSPSPVFYIYLTMTTKSQQSKAIGVFDSGIGGLTVVRALMRELPHENIIYFGDTARVPYGPKSPQVIREYAAQDTDFLISKSVKMVVIACNTVSSVAIDVVQKHAKVPVVGVILPGARAAAGATKKKHVGVIGTVGTIASNAYTNAIRQIDNSINVIGQACQLFVPLAEEGWIDHKATELIAREYLFPLKLQRIDTLVLGCTHYPILRTVIQKVFDNGVTLIDSGEATALEVARVLEEEDLSNPSRMKANVQFFVSDISSKFAEVGERFLGQSLGRVRRADGIA
jgi:glutamate racemase